MYNMELKLSKTFDPVRNEIWYIVDLNGNKQFFMHEENARKRFVELKDVQNTQLQETVLETHTIYPNDRIN